MRKIKICIFSSAQILLTNFDEIDMHHIGKTVPWSFFAPKMSDPYNDLTITQIEKGKSQWRFISETQCLNGCRMSTLFQYYNHNWYCFYFKIFINVGNIF